MSKSVVLLLLFGTCLSTQAFCQSEDTAPDTYGGVKVRPWPERLWRELNIRLDGSGVQLSTALFNMIGDLDLISIPIGSTQLALHNQRTVFDNADFANTWTVIDRFYLESRIPIFTFTPTVNFGPLALNFGLTVGGKTGLAWADVRQVAAHSKKKEKKIEEVVGEIQESEGYKELAELHGQGDIVNIPVEDDTFVLDPANPARYKKIFNGITIPFKAPFTLERFNKMELRELISYSGYGSIEINAGVSVGVQASTLLKTIQAGVGAKITFNGAFAISVLKKDKKHALVKLSRIGSAGLTPKLFQSTLSQDLELGIVVFDHKLAVPGLTNFPLQFSIDKSISRLLDIVYEYDLTQPDGARAFEHAALGDFKPSAELSKHADATKAVTFTLKSDALNHHRQNHSGIDLFFVIQKSRDSIEDSTVSAIVLPDGKHDITREILSRVYSTNTGYGVNRKIYRTFTLTLDNFASHQNKEDAFTLLVENSRDDSFIKKKLLEQTIDEAQRLLGKFDLFPPIDEYVTSGDGAHQKVHKLRFGHSSFYYGYTLHRSELEKIASLTDNQKRDVVLKTFGIQSIFCPSIPCSILKEWKTLHSDLDLHQQIQKFKSMLHHFRRMDEVIFLPKYALATIDPQAKIDYYLTAQNSAFGRIQYQSKDVSELDRIMLLADGQKKFEFIGSQLEQDSEAKINGFQLKVASPHHLTLSLNLAKNPKWLYFRLLQLNALSGSHILAEKLFTNSDARFKSGNNTLDIAIDSKDELGVEIAKLLRGPKLYRLEVGYTQDGTKWGAGTGSPVEIKSDFNPVQNTQEAVGEN